MIKRDFTKALLSWKKRLKRDPLLVQGLRASGKTHTIRAFANEYFDNVAEINLLKQPEFINLFAKGASPSSILQKISLSQEVKLRPQKSLLFFDEIQMAPSALRLLKDLSKASPEQHILATGIHFNHLASDDDCHLDLESVMQAHLFPLSFNEFINARDLKDLSLFLNQVQHKTRISPSIHEKLLYLLRDFLLVGGMPQAVSTHIKDLSSTSFQQTQRNIIRQFYQDMAALSPKTMHKYLTPIWDSAPHLTAQNYKYSQVSKDIQSRELKSALSTACRATYLIKSKAIRQKKRLSRDFEAPFRIFHPDTGLYTFRAGFQKDLALGADLVKFQKGVVAKQLVAQELLSSTPAFDTPSLCHWKRDKRGSSSEVDFIVNTDGVLIPIIIRAGKIGTLKGVRLFFEEHPKTPFAIRLSTDPPSLDKKILTLPLYAAGQIRRIIKALL